MIMDKLGDGTTTDRHTPVKIMDNVASVSAGHYHTLITKTDGSLWACGHNNYGQIGDGTTTDRLIPVKILEGSTNTAIDDVEVQPQETKANDGIFSLSGQRLTTPHKGINIINGKKVVIK